MNESNSYPNDEPANGMDYAIWYAEGCYRKHVKEKRFKASKSLKLDLEYLFLKGFDRNGPKKGKDKYTPVQALVYLQNLTLDNGRRKYSPDPLNLHGPLPTKQYIQGWFSRRKGKMAEEERRRAVTRRGEMESRGEGGLLHEISRYDDVDDGCDQDELLINTDNKYHSYSPTQLEELVSKRFGVEKVTPKIFFRRLLKDDDILHGCEEENIRYESMKIEEMKKMCLERTIVNKMPGALSKKLHIIYLRGNDRVLQMQSSERALDQIITRHQSEEYLLARVNSK